MFDEPDDDLRAAHAYERQIVTTSDWRELAQHYGTEGARLGKRLAIEVTPGNWALGNVAAYWGQRPQPMRLTRGEHRAILLGIGLWNRFPHYVEPPWKPFFVDIDDNNATFVAEWRLRQAVQVLDPVEEAPGVVPMPLRRAADLSPIDLASIRAALEPNLARIARRMLSGTVQPLDLPRATIWHPVWG